MGIFEHFPYTNFHNLNLDRILERTAEAEEAVKTSEAAVIAAADDMAAASAAADDAVNTANSALNAFETEKDAITFKLTWDAGELAYTSISLENIPQQVDMYKRIQQCRLSAVAVLDKSAGSIPNYVAPIHFEATNGGMICYFIIDDVFSTTLHGVTLWHPGNTYLCIFDITSNNNISNISLHAVEP